MFREGRDKCGTVYDFVLGVSLFVSHYIDYNLPVSERDLGPIRNSGSSPRSNVSKQAAFPSISGNFVHIEVLV